MFILAYYEKKSEFSPLFAKKFSTTTESRGENKASRRWKVWKMPKVSEFAFLINFISYKLNLKSFSPGETAISLHPPTSVDSTNVLEFVVENIQRFPLDSCFFSTIDVCSNLIHNHIKVSAIRNSSEHNANIKH